MFTKFIQWFKFVFAQREVVLIPTTTRFLEPTKSQELPNADFKGVVKLGIIVGHSKSDEGAVMCKPFLKSEYAYGTEIALEAQRSAPMITPRVSVEVIYRDHVGIAGAYAKARELLCDAVIELHFNAFDGKTTGTETLCSADASDVEFAHEVHGLVCAAFNRVGQSRGVRTISKSTDGGINVHSFPNGVNCLVEPFFGDNPDDAMVGVSRASKYAASLLIATELWAKKIDMLK